MVRTLIFTILFTIPIAMASDGSGSWVNHWWENVYQKQVEPTQLEQIRKREINQCQSKLQEYRAMVDKHPKSEYYQYKLEQWKEKCND